MTLEELTALVLDIKQPHYRAKQLYSFLYKQKGTQLHNAFTLPTALIHHLDASHTISSGSILKHQQSLDGTTKILYDFAGSRVEAVLIPEGSRRTLCVSSQVGCSLSCTFCHTGVQRLERNLTAAEILAQVLAFPTPDAPTNVVFMGQGEPLYNWRSVAAAIRILTDPHGMALGRGSVVLSTSGIAPLIPKVASELGVMLAISLHAPTDSLRYWRRPAARCVGTRSCPSTRRIRCGHWSTPATATWTSLQAHSAESRSST